MLPLPTVTRRWLEHQIKWYLENAEIIKEGEEYQTFLLHQANVYKLALCELDRREAKEGF